MNKYESLFYNIETAWDCPPLTNEAIVLAEQRLGHPLPAAYLDVLRVHNGGYLRRSIYPKRYLPYLHNYLHLPVLYGIGGEEGIDSNLTWHEDIPRCKYLATQLGVDPIHVVVISRFGRFGLVLDYSKLRGSEPSLCFVYVGNSPEVNLEYIDESFASFIDSLEVDSEIECQFESIEQSPSENGGGLQLMHTD